MTETTEEKSGMPLKQELFLEAGVHIGTKIRTSDMRQYIYRRRDDGLFVLDVRQIADHLMAAAKLLAKYKPEEIAVVASRIYSGNPASKFAKLTGVTLIKGRFTPGTMTNMTYKGFAEPRLILVCDPKGERDALLESAKNGVTVVAFCDTDNETKFIDLVVPINNKGKRSLAIAFYVLARELMLAQGKISSYSEFPYNIRFFEELAVEEEEVAEKEEGAEGEAPSVEEPAGEEKPEEAPASEEKPEEPTNEEKPAKEHEEAKKKAKKKHVKEHKAEEKAEEKPAEKHSHPKKEKDAPEKEASEKEE